jgi:hypothetical protein
MSSNIGDNRANNNRRNTSTKNSNDNVHSTKNETLSL